MSPKNKYDVWIALIWAGAFIVPTLWVANNLQDLSEAKVIGYALASGGTVHGLFRATMR